MALTKSYEQSKDKDIIKLATMKDNITGEWLYGRKAILNRISNVTEWRVRMLMKRAREPSEIDKLISINESLSVPQIIVNIGKLSTKKPKKSKLEKWVIASDFQAPYENPYCCNIFYQILEEINPDKVVLLGDVVNLDVLSKFDKIPNKPDNWIDDITAASRILGSTKKAAPKAKLEWFKGNHEERLYKYLIRQDPSFYSVLDLKKLFILTDNEKHIIDWDFVNETEHLYEDLNLVLAHGNLVRKHAGTSAKAHVEYLLMSVIIGHSHRQAIYKKTSGRSIYFNEPPLFGIENGCMCNYDLPYTGGKTQDWQQGFSILTIDRSTDKPILHPTLIEINNKQAYFREKIYRG